MQEEKARSYDDVLISVTKNIPFLEKFVQSLNMDSDDKSQKIMKMYELLSSKRKLKYENLVKCEDVIKKLKEKSNTLPIKPIEEPSVSILKKAVKAINGFSEEDVLKSQPLSVVDIKKLIEENYVSPLENQVSQRNIMDTAVNTKQQHFHASSNNNIQIVVPMHPDIPSYSIHSTQPTCYQSSFIEEVRKDTSFVNYHQMNQPRLSQYVAQNSKDPRISHYHRIDATYNNQNAAPFFNNFGPSSSRFQPISNTSSSVFHRRMSVHPTIINNNSNKKTIQRRKSVSSTINKFNLVEQRKNDEQKREKLDEVAPIYGNNIDKLIKFPEKEVESNLKVPQFDKMYKSINTETFKSTPPLMGKSSFSGNFKIPKIKSTPTVIEPTENSNIDQIIQEQKTTKNNPTQNKGEVKKKVDVAISNNNEKFNINNDSKGSKIKKTQKHFTDTNVNAEKNVKDASGKTNNRHLLPRSEKKNLKKTETRHKKTDDATKYSIEKSEIKTSEKTSPPGHQNPADKTVQLQDYLKGLNIAQEKIEKIQQIVCEKETVDASKNDLPVKEEFNQAIDDLNVKHLEKIASVQKQQQKKKSTRKKGKSELDKLNEDINEMFIRDEVLNATGKRKCAQKKVNYFKHEQQTARKRTTKRITEKIDIKKSNMMKVNKHVNVKKLKRLQVIVSAKVHVKNLKKQKKATTSTSEKRMKTPLEKTTKSIKLILSKTKNCKESFTRSKSTFDCPNQKQQRSAIFNTGKTAEPKNKRKSVHANICNKNKRKADSISVPQPTKRAHIEAEDIKIRNTRIAMNSQSVVYVGKCIICNFSISEQDDDAHLQMVKHYSTKHSNAPNFISRFAKHESDVLKFGNNPLKCEGTFNNNILSAKCLFCNKVREYIKEDWVIHLMNHTGEYKYKCKTCSVVSNNTIHEVSSCKEQNLELINSIDFEDNRLYGYLCRHCNFVQLNQENFQNHLEIEHREYKESEIKFCVVGYKNKKQPKKDNILGENMPVPLRDIKKEEPKDLFEDKNQIENFGFNKLNDSFWFLCLFEDCNFTTNIKEHIFLHADDVHKTEFWHGRCDSCKTIISNETKQLKEELDHLMLHTSTPLEECVPTLQFTDEVLNVVKKEVVDTGPQELINLMPWENSKKFKSFPHGKEQTTKKSLYSFYKCSGKSCAYTGEDSKMMLEHLKNHELVGEINTDDTNDRKSWLECSYCNFFASDNKHLLDHLDENHRSGFQCGICFYRAIEAYHVLIHHDMHHKNLDFKILVMDENLTTQKKLDQDLLTELEESKKKNVKPLICTVCNVKFLKLNLYMPHLYEHNEELIECNICAAPIEKKKMAIHLTNHAINIYQCLYCDFGSNIQKVMRSHITNLHSNKYLYTFIRTKRSDLSKDESIQDSSISNDFFYLGGKLEKGSFEVCPYTTKQLNFKSVDTKSNLDINYDKTIQIIQTMPLLQFPKPQYVSEKVEDNTRTSTNSGGDKFEEIVKMAYQITTKFSYKCSIKDCQKSFKNQLELHDHLSINHKHVENLSCEYCAKIIKTQKYYVCHLRKHDPFSQRFFCYMNDFNDTTAEKVKTHIKEEHKQMKTKSMFFHKMKNDVNKDLIIICPAIYTRNELKHFYQNQINKYSNRQFN